MDKLKKAKAKWVLLTVLISAIVILFSLFIGFGSAKQKENRIFEAKNNAQTVIAAIQQTLDTSMEVSGSLMSFYSVYGDEAIDNFDSIAESIAKNHPYIDSMYIAPKAVIACAWPESVKDSTIGFAMLEDPAQGPRAQIAISTRKVTVAGPHHLLEGNNGFIIRNPLFEGDNFIGFSIIIINWDSFVDTALSKLNDVSKDYNFSVKKKLYDATAIMDEYGCIISNCSKQVGDKIQVEFQVPNDVWILSIEPKKGWNVFSAMLVPSLMFLTFSAFFVIAIFFGYTASVRKRELRYETESNSMKTHYMNQLQEALEKTKKAEAAKTEFLSHMSHDIRTPLNGIIGLLEINEKHADDRELVDSNRVKMRIAANHLLELISDVLDLSKMGDDNVKLSHEPFNVRDLAIDVLTITNMRATEAGIKISVDADENSLGVPYVYGSPLHLRQILLNIFSNAVKYNKPNGLVKCSVEELNRTEHLVTYCFVISDTGIGMSKEFLEHLFEPFTQEHSDARSTYLGTGLGMAIVKKLVEKMGGNIAVESEVGKGTTFRVTIPFEIASKEDFVSIEAKNCADLNGLNLLVVEDNDINLEIAEAILVDLGATVTTAKNGQEAVDEFLSCAPGTYDGILMDLMMPVMDGYEATAQIRTSFRAEGATIPIIAMTANAFEEDVQKCREAGMNAHISKPIDIQALLKALSTIPRR